jgi:hypothetical protein
MCIYGFVKKVSFWMKVGYYIRKIIPKSVFTLKLRGFCNFHMGYIKALGIQKMEKMGFFIDKLERKKNFKKK